MRSKTVVILIAVLMPAILSGQYGYPRARRSGPNQTKSTGAYGGPAVTFRGKLKELTKREIVIETDEDQALAIGRYRKTKFIKDNREIKAADIPIGAALTVDVTKDPDLKPLALNVFVDPVKNAAK
ncbi:MAG: hypothetical protein M3Z85_06020 [Acidobacteriota bacterium]|nr:hypothetical protein [Acidobacteriota bacterium]